MTNADNANNSPNNNKNTRSHRFRDLCVRILPWISLFPIFVFIVFIIVVRVYSDLAETVEIYLSSYYPHHNWEILISLYLPFIAYFLILPLIYDRTPLELRHDFRSIIVTISVTGTVTLFLSALVSGWLGVIAWAFATLIIVPLMISRIVTSRSIQ